MSLEVGKFYENKTTRKKVLILGRLNTIAKEGCLICEDVTYGMILPIINENSENWIEVNCPPVDMKGVNSKYEDNSAKGI